MREALLIAIVAPLCCIALVRPKIGLFGYVWFALMRPDVLAFAAGHLSLSAALAFATLIGSLRFIGSASRLWRNPFSIAMILLQCVFYLSALLAVNPSLSEGPYAIQLRVVCMALLQVVLIRDVIDLKHFLVLMGLSLGAIGLKYGAAGMLHGGAVYTYGYAGFLEDNNNLALALVMVSAVCWYARLLTRATWLKSALLATMLGSTATVIMTHSRGGFLALAAVILLIAFRSKQRVAAGLILGMTVGGTIYLVRDTFFSRMETLQDPMEDASARFRIIAAKAGLKIAEDYPAIGVGFGSENERALIGRYMDVEEGVPNIYLHNTYLQVLVDSGVFAALLYVMLLFGAIFWLWRSARRARQYYPDLAPIPLGLQTALIGYALGCYFLSRVTFDFTYMLLMSTATWCLVEKELLINVRAAQDQHPELAVPDETLCGAIKA